MIDQRNMQKNLKSLGNRWLNEKQKPEKSNNCKVAE